VEFVTKNTIITKQVLNNNTGELESIDFREVRDKTKIRGGFNMIYHKSYEEITEAVITSNKDLKLFNWITNQFTYARVEAPLVYSICDIDVSQPKFSKFIKQLVKLEYICRVAHGIYRLNPFIYVPFKADASILQKEWIVCKTTNRQKLEEEFDLRNQLHMD
jgi:hypothetical protein